MYDQGGQMDFLHLEAILELHSPLLIRAWAGASLESCLLLSCPVQLPQSRQCGGSSSEKAPKNDQREASSYSV